MPKNKKLKGDLVYSTNPDLMLRLSQEKPIITPPPHQQDLKVWIDRKQRKGKVATLITGFVGSDDNVTAFAISDDYSKIAFCQYSGVNKMHILNGENGEVIFDTFYYSQKFEHLLRINRFL